MFTKKNVRNRTVAIEVIGFSLVATVIWCNEIFDLPHLWFGALTSPTRFVEASMETIVLLGVSIFVVTATLKLFRRLAEQMSSLAACSQCQRVKYQGDWMEFDEYLEERLDTRSSYGMCPFCIKMVRDMIDVPISDEHTLPPAR